ncbi:peptidoglycan DD-metalloendopeptidase family protein [Thiohalomonas denitrificans]|uniref:peptidoglycan DD-metalloendopeptidase family protein n=1 Tax=Thiohalomonas denitrificans TaxID=415747 RepID=UPI0026EB9348|nr:peptidoglycan DD-metalloendopeptidase family protein [Thiohalomonas denitrificans]
MPQTRDTGYHHVRSGDTLYSIAFDYGLDYREIARWNRIISPYRIYPGQQLSLTPSDRKSLKSLAYYSKPVEDKSIRAWKPEQRGESPKPQARLTTTPTKKRTPSASRATASRSAAKTFPIERTESPQNQKVTASTKWRWPTTGKVVTRFALQKGKKGIDIQGQAGQMVLATAGGQVVYSGKGLIGYGNMVIIKHSDTYLSAYGHNRRLLVGEGEQVKPGQKIAEMGQRSKSGSILHFEIRKNGRPVDPMRYLPTKN